MTHVLFHCTFTDRAISGHVHPKPGCVLDYTYGACLIVRDEHEVNVAGGIIVQTNVHDSDEFFRIKIIDSIKACPNLESIILKKFIMQPFRIAVTDEYVFDEGLAYFNTMAEKYLAYASRGGEN